MTSIPGLEGSSPILDKYGYLPGLANPQSNQNLFLNLLVTQMSNQNPLEPMDNDSIINQMSSFATVEQIESLNSKINDLVTIEQIVAGQNAFTQSASLVGKNIEYLDPDSGDQKSGYVDSVHLDGQGLLLNVGGTKVPMNLVTGIIGSGSNGSEQGDTSEDTTEV